jgi:hypothetical protein
MFNINNWFSGQDNRDTGNYEGYEISEDGKVLNPGGDNPQEDDVSWIKWFTKNTDDDNEEKD